MKKFGFATIAATGFAAALVGLAAPAQATVLAAPAGLTSVEIRTDLGHQQWVVDNQQRAQTSVPSIVGNGR